MLSGLKLLEGWGSFLQHWQVDQTRNAILVLEDSETRFDLMAEALVSVPRKFVIQRWKTVPAMRAELQQWLSCACLVSLDFDLSGSGIRNPGNGLEAVSVLTGYSPVCPVIVHTSLTEIGQMMSEALRDRGWVVEQVRFNSYEAAQDWVVAVERLAGGGDERTGLNAFH